jgi:hypothetical protein
MRVPRKPVIMSGPWLAGKFRTGTGRSQPNRTSPAQRAARSERAAKAIKGKRERCRDIMAFESDWLHREIK